MSMPDTAARSTTGSFASSCCSILFQRFAHSADGINLIVKGPPVVVIGNGVPDCFNLVDVHRTGLSVGPVRVRFGLLAAFQSLGERAEGLGWIKLVAGVAA